jgi:hypothetical protein
MTVKTTCTAAVTAPTLCQSENPSFTVVIALLQPVVVFVDWDGALIGFRHSRRSATERFRLGFLGTRQCEHAQ